MRDEPIIERSQKCSIESWRESCLTLDGLLGNTEKVIMVKLCVSIWRVITWIKVYQQLEGLELVRVDDSHH